jgi:hypothetical protein
MFVQDMENMLTSWRKKLNISDRMHQVRPPHPTRLDIEQGCVRIRHFMQIALRISGKALASSELSGQVVLLCGFSGTHSNIRGLKNLCCRRHCQKCRQKEQLHSVNADLCTR